MNNAFTTKQHSKTDKMMRKTTILTLTLSLLSSVQLWAKDYRVSDFGAVADGTTLNTRALQRAIDVIHEEGGGKLIFPLGRYVSGTRLF